MTAAAPDTGIIRPQPPLLDLRIRKHTPLQSVLDHQPTGSWNLPTAEDKGISAPPTISKPYPPAISNPCHGPTSSWKHPTAVDKAISTPHYGLTGSWKLNRVMDEGSTVPPTTTVPSYPPPPHFIMDLQAAGSSPQPWAKGSPHHPPPLYYSITVVQVARSSPKPWTE